MKINDEGTSNAAHWYKRAMNAEARLAEEESAHRVTAGIFASTLVRADAAEARIKPLEETVAAQYAHNVLLEVRLQEAIDCCTIKDNRNLWLEIRLQKVMARCADLLDEDQFNELDAMVTGECGCGICDACVVVRPI